MSRAEDLENAYEPRPDPQSLTSNPSNNSSSGVDYEPHPEKSIQIPADRERIVKSITSLYSGSASEEDMQVYAAEAVYDDPWSYCDTRYKIAGQWYGMQADFLSSSGKHARSKDKNAPLSSCLMFRIYMLTARFPITSRDPQSHGLLAHPRDRNRLQHTHRARVQVAARIHPTPTALFQTSQ